MTIGIVDFIQGNGTGLFYYFFSFISFLGENYVYIAVIGFIYWVYNKKLGEIMVITLAFSAVLNNALKELIGAKRPYEKYPDKVQNLRNSTSTGNSFPSGHTQNFTALLFAEGFHIKKQRFFIVATILSTLMMLSRMYLGVHFLEDVVAALLLGILVAYFVSFLYNKYEENIMKLYKMYLIVLLILLPTLFIFKDHDYFTSIGLLYGVVIALIFENKFVNFTTDISIKQKVIRYIVGLILLLSVQEGLGMVFDSIINYNASLANALDFIRYFFVGFIGFGVYPFIFKKLNF